MFRLFFFVFILVIMAGCAAIGPVGTQEYGQLVAKAVPKDDGQVIIYGPSNWHPNTRGFTAIRSSFLAGPSPATPGVLVLTSNSLIVEQWIDELKSFDVIKRIPYTELASASLDSYGASRRLVVRKKDLSYDSFEFTKVGGNLIDSAKTEEATELLRGLIKP